MLGSIKFEIAFFLNSLGLLPSRYKDKFLELRKGRSTFLQKVRNTFTVRALEKKLFESKELKFSSGGYWYLDPMPTKEELANYYSTVYWNERGDKQCFLKLRDVHHFKDIMKITGHMDSSFVFLNFGSGHGGVSHLVHAKGASVVNIEPSDADAVYGERWACFGTIEEYLESDGAKPVDFLYSSHSIEHVHDIELFLELVKKVTRSGATLMFETPNCASQAAFAGGVDGRIHIPHTYYFRKEFFTTFFSDARIIYLHNNEEVSAEEDSDSIKVICSIDK